MCIYKIQIILMFFIFFSLTDSIKIESFSFINLHHRYKDRDSVRKLKVIGDGCFDEFKDGDASDRNNLIPNSFYWTDVFGCVIHTPKGR